MSASAPALHHCLDGPQGAPVVVLSGSLGTDLSMWDPQAAALAGPYRVLRYDLRGHGRSPVPPGPYGIADLGRDLLALLDRTGIERAVLCGLSIGAMISLWVAATAPDRVQGVVVCCTTAYLEPERAATYRERARRVRAEGVAAVADAVIERWFTPAFVRARPDTVERFRAALTATPADGYAGCCEAVAALDLRALLPSIRVPTLVVAGEADEATPPAHGRAIADAVSGAEYTVLPGAAHLASVERAELVSALLLRFLGDRSVESSSDDGTVERRIDE